MLFSVCLIDFLFSFSSTFCVLSYASSNFIFFLVPALWAGCWGLWLLSTFSWHCVVSCVGPHGSVCFLCAFWSVSVSFSSLPVVNYVMFLPQCLSASVLCTLQGRAGHHRVFSSFAGSAPQMPGAQLTPPPSCQENVSWRQNPLCLDSLFQSDFKKIFFSYLLTYLSFPACFILLYKFRFPSGAISFCLKDFFLHFCSASLLVANAFIHALGNVFISP